MRRQHPEYADAPQRASTIRRERGSGSQSPRRAAIPGARSRTAASNRVASSESGFRSAAPSKLLPVGWTFFVAINASKRRATVMAPCHGQADTKPVLPSYANFI
jgi:hypothetical protein